MRARCVWVHSAFRPPWTDWGRENRLTARVPYILRSSESSLIAPRDAATTKDGFIHCPLSSSVLLLLLQTPPQGANGCDARTAYDGGGGGGGNGLTQSVKRRRNRKRSRLSARPSGERVPPCHGLRGCSSSRVRDIEHESFLAKSEGRRGRMELPGHGTKTATTTTPSAAARPTVSLR